MSALERALAERARTQFGLVTRPQMRAAGFSDRMVDHRLAEGALAVVHQGVFRLAGVPASWRQSLLGAVLAGGPEAVASHRSAALLHGMDGFRTAPVEITSRRNRNRFGPGVIVHRPLVLMPVDRADAGGIPCTSPALTLINLGAVLPPDRVEEALDSAVRLGLVRIPFLRWRVGELSARGRPGIGVMRALLDKEEAQRPRSVLERRFLRAWEGRGLPVPVLQYEVYDDFGMLLAKGDFGWPDHRTILEVDGHGSHATRAERAADNARTLRVSALGITVVRLTYEQVIETPEWAVSHVAEVLRSRA
jgi:hypothetical protein